MATERTLSIVKPDGVQKNLIGEVYRRFEQAGLQIVAARMLHLSREQAEGWDRTREMLAQVGLVIDEQASQALVHGRAVAGLACVVLRVPKAVTASADILTLPTCEPRVLVDEQRRAG